MERGVYYVVEIGSCSKDTSRQIDLSYLFRVHFCWLESHITKVVILFRLRWQAANEIEGVHTRRLRVDIFSAVGSEE